MSPTPRTGIRSSARLVGWTAGASAVVAVAAALAGLWLIVIGVAGAWLRMVLWAGHHALVVVPEQAAGAALDEGWRRPQWRGEDLVAAELAALVNGRSWVARRAGRLVRTRAIDPGTRSVALERLAHVAATAQRTAAARRRRWAQTVLAPAAVAVLAGTVALLALSESTPGPVIAHPWRTGVSLVAAAGTAAAMASAAQQTAFRKTRGDSG